MKKIILVIVILILVLLFSWWARNAKFNLIPLATSLSREKNASVSGIPTTTNTPTPIPVEIIITITPNGFVPDSLMINQGTKITWVNKSGLTANISSDPENSFPALNLGNLWENSSVSLTFTTPGRYHYLNGKNTLQKGTLIVR